MVAQLGSARELKDLWDRGTDELEKLL